MIETQIRKRPKGSIFKLFNKAAFNHEGDDIIQNREKTIKSRAGKLDIKDHKINENNAEKYLTEKNNEEERGKKEPYSSKTAYVSISNAINKLYDVNQNSEKTIKSRAGELEIKDNKINEKNNTEKYLTEKNNEEERVKKEPYSIKADYISNSNAINKLYDEIQHL